jgi:hypothetical protein
VALLAMGLLVGAGFVMLARRGGQTRTG